MFLDQGTEILEIQSYFREGGGLVGGIAEKSNFLRGENSGGNILGEENPGRQMSGGKLS